MEGCGVTPTFSLGLCCSEVSPRTWEVAGSPQVWIKCAVGGRAETRGAPSPRGWEVRAGEEAPRGWKPHPSAPGPTLCSDHVTQAGWQILLSWLLGPRHHLPPRSPGASAVGNRPGGKPSGTGFL